MIRGHNDTHAFYWLIIILDIEILLIDFARYSFVFLFFKTNLKITISDNLLKRGELCNIDVMGEEGRNAKC